MPAIGNAIRDWKKDYVSKDIDRMEGIEVWTVQFDGRDDPRERLFLAMNAPGLPRMYSSHPYHVWLTSNTKYTRDFSVLGLG